MKTLEQRLAAERAAKAHARAARAAFCATYRVGTDDKGDYVAAVLRSMAEPLTPPQADKEEAR